MEAVQTPVRDSRMRSNWVRLRTLIMLRWMAITGQVLAIVIAVQVFGIVLDLRLCFVVIGAAVALNVVAQVAYPETLRLSEPAAATMLLFDLGQLSALIAISGGLNNPFAMLILAPVTISATALKPLTTVLLGMAAVTMMSLAGLWYMPLTLADGTIIAIPTIFEFGFWASITIGIVFLGIFAQRVSSETHAMSDALAATQIALARAQQLTDLGGVVAATAHEFGTPLATIKLASSELIEELAEQPALQDDARLIREQAERCASILQSMGRVGKEDLHLRTAPLESLLQEAAEPHENRGIPLLYDLSPLEGGTLGQPILWRKPEVIHAIRNFIQNAVDFAETSVLIEAGWSAKTIRIRISDDGPGFPAGMLGRIGDPFISGREPQSGEVPRAGYEGMGLGLFISKTLLERTGARLSFANKFEAGEHGAIAECVWSGTAMAQICADDRVALGENRLFSGHPNVSLTTY